MSPAEEQLIRDDERRKVLAEMEATLGRQADRFAHDSRMLTLYTKAAVVALLRLSHQHVAVFGKITIKAAVVDEHAVDWDYDIAKQEYVFAPVRRGY